MTSAEFGLLLSVYGTKATDHMVRAAHDHLVEGVSQNQAAKDHGVDVGALNRFVKIRLGQAEDLSKQLADAKRLFIP